MFARSQKAKEDFAKKSKEEAKEGIEREWSALDAVKKADFEAKAASLREDYEEEVEEWKLRNAGVLERNKNLLKMEKTNSYKHCKFLCSRDTSCVGIHYCDKGSGSRDGECFLGSSWAEDGVQDGCQVKRNAKKVWTKIQDGWDHIEEIYNNGSSKEFRLSSLKSCRALCEANNRCKAVGYCDNGSGTNVGQCWLGKSWKVSNSTTSKCDNYINSKLEVRKWYCVARINEDVVVPYSTLEKARKALNENVGTPSNRQMVCEMTRQGATKDPHVVGGMQQGAGPVGNNGLERYWYGWDDIETMNAMCEADDGCKNYSQAEAA